jgi:pimeloyl-ACP methyl ester carboxylesterase
VTSADPEAPPSEPTWTRRRLLAAGASGVVGIVGVAVVGYELVEHGVLPGKQRLDELDGACSVSTPKLSFATPGPSRSGTFFSAARHRTVGYTIAYPPNHGPGSALPLVISLHGDGGNHRSGLGALSLTSALAARSGRRALPPFALVSVDGGNLYWNPHPGDDPLTMLVDELIPLCRHRGLGLQPGQIGTIGISMGGYGSLLLAERHPDLISAVAAISPAVWTSYPQARSASADAFASAADWTADNVIAHASALDPTPVRVASGTDDPLHPGAVALAKALPHSAVIEFTGGCHDTAFFSSQQHASLAFLGDHLSAT